MSGIDGTPQSRQGGCDRPHFGNGSDSDVKEMVEDESRVEGRECGFAGQVVW